MNTIKRAMPDVQTINKNYSRYQNQMQFKGIVVDENIYDIDQQSSRDAKNVYVDDNLQLVSRPPLQHEDVPYDAIPTGGNYILVDIYDYSSAKVYVSQNKTNNKYTVICIPAEYDYETNRVYYTLANLTKYNLCSIEQYIICFNDVNAKILDTNKFYTTGYDWELLTDNCSIPVTKIVNKEGIQVFTLNDFIPDVYKEQYIWSEGFQPTLPSASEANVILNNNQGEFDLGNISEPDKLTEYRVATKVNYDGDLQNVYISAAKATVCIATDEYVYYSLDYGKTFQRIYYPQYSGDFFNIAEVSKDGDYFFFVTRRGVYRCDLGTQKWANVFAPPVVPILESIEIDVTSTIAVGSILKKYSIIYGTVNGVSYTNVELANDLVVTSTSTVLAPTTIDAGSTIQNGSIINGEDYFNEILGDHPEYKANYMSYFLTSDTFCFLTSYQASPYSTKIVRLYFKGHGLYTGNDYTDDHMSTDTAEDIIKYYTLQVIDRLAWDDGGAGVTTPLSEVIPIVNTNVEDKRYYRKLLSMNTFTDANDRLTTGITIVCPKVNNTTTSQAVVVYGGEATGRLNLQMYRRAFSITQSNGYNVKDIQLLSATYSSLAPQSTFKAYTIDTTNDHYMCEINIGVTGYSINDDLIPTSYNLIGQMPNVIDNYYLFIWSTSFVVCDNSGNEYSSIPNIVASNSNIIIADNIFYTIGRQVFLQDFEVKTMNTYTIGIGSVLAAGSVVNGKINSQYYRANTILDFDTTITEPSYVYKGSIIKADSLIINGLWTNYVGENDLLSFIYTYGVKSAYTKVPNVTYSDTELYLGFDNLLQITSNARDEEDSTKILFNLPNINNKTFIENITGMINISTTEVALFFEGKIRICTKVQDENFLLQNKGYRYDYYNTKLSTGIRLGDSVINTLEGSYTIFPTLRGLAALNYQAFMATTDQVIEYVSDDIKEIWTEFFEASNENGKQIRIIQWRNRLVLTNNTTTILMFDLNAKAWWKWEVFDNVLIALSDQINLKLIKDQLLVFKDSTIYYDMSESGQRIPIEWYIMSQPLHFNAPNHYKNLRQLVFQFADHFKTGLAKTMNAQIKLYRKKITVRDPECFDFKIEELRTFVKRFNYWKINEVQWALSSDEDTKTPQPLELNAIDIKYEIGEEVR